MMQFRHLLRFPALVLFLFLVACGRAAAPDTPPTVAEEPTQMPTPTLAPPVLVVEPTAAPTDTAPAAPEAAAPESAAPTGPWPADAFGYGVQSHATVGDPRYAMEVIRNQLHLDWVKVQLEWPVVQPDPATFQWFFYDGVVAEANAQGLRLLFSVVGAPAWTRASGTLNGPPDDFNQYATFLSQLLEHYPGQIDAIEVWNEQNLDREWTTAEGLSPAAYVNFLSLAYQTIEAHDPNVIVISGALAPTGVHDRVTAMDDFIYLDEMLAAGLLNVADCVGAHHNGYNIGPDVAFDQTGQTAEAATAFFRGPFDNLDHSWSFKTTLDTYAQKVQAVDPAKKLCVTEFGWASSEGYDTYPEGFGFALDNTLDEQAQYIVQAFQQMRDSGQVWLAFLFNFDFGNKGNGPTDDTVPYSLVDINGAPRPAFTAVANMDKSR
ncbi:MAG: hypothetical protein AB1791_03490 [Chloroflexota bacterium]